MIKQITAEQTYDLRHRVMHPNFPMEYIKLTKDQEGIHFGLFVDEKCITVVSIFLEDNKLQYRKLATEESEQGKGYGSQMLRHVMTYAKKQKATTVWCNARVNKTDFYFKFGMVKTNKTYFKGGFDYVIMEKIL